MRVEKRLIKKYKPRTYNGELLILAVLAFVVALVYIIDGNNWQIEPIETPKIAKIVYYAEYYERNVTAYNVGIKAQTDDTPCIGASNKDLCQAIEQGKKICAANFVPLGTKLNIEGFGTCEVADRMNKRYTNRVDIAFAPDQIQEAKEFGVKQLDVAIIK